MKITESKMPSNYVWGRFVVRRKMSKSYKFEWKNFIKSVAAIAIPVALQNLLTTTGSMVDTMMIAPLGEMTVGAVGLCAQFSTLLFSCYWGFVGGGMLFIAQYWGAKDEKGIDRAFETTLGFMMSVALIFTGVSFFKPDFVMSVYTDKESIQALGAGYLKIVCFSYPMQILSVAMSSLLRSTEKVRIPLVASVASVASNLTLNYILIYGKLGAPALGEKGAALATVIASAINVLTIIIYAKIKKYPYLFHFLKNPRLSADWMKQYLKKCFPIICNELLVGIGFTVNNIVLGRQAEEVIAAIAVFRTIEGIVIAFFSGFSNASAVIVGQSVGAGEHEKAYNTAKRLVLLCGGFIAVACSGIMCVHTPLLKAMSLSGDSFKYCTGFVGIYCVAAVFRMCNWTQNDTYRSAGDATYGTVLEIAFMYFMVIPCVCISGLWLKLPVYLVFACCYIDEPIRFILMQKHMYSAKWIKPVTAIGKEALVKFMENRKKAGK